MAMKPSDDDDKTVVPRAVPGEKTKEELPDLTTPPMGPQSGPLSPFGSNPSPAHDAWIAEDKKKREAEAKGEKYEPPPIPGQQPAPQPQPAAAPAQPASPTQHAPAHATHEQKNDKR